MLRLNDNDNPEQLTRTSLTEEGYREDDLREWIIRAPEEFLGEDILLIGREVTVKNLGDGIDLLGIDRDANLIIIELKKGDLRGSVDFQALKYAAITAQWDYNDIKNQFDNFVSTKWGNHLYDQDISFTETLDEFCNEDYALNQDQRILLVGESITDRLDLVVRWLAEKAIDIAAHNVNLLDDNDTLFVDSEQIIPLPETTAPTAAPDTSEQPWKTDGHAWHLEERTNDDTSGLLRETAAAIEEIEELDGPYWGQKLYISFKVARKNRVILRTYTELFHVRIFDIDPEEISPEDVAITCNAGREDVTVDDPLGGSGRPGLQITRRPSDGIETEELTKLIQQFI